MCRNFTYLINLLRVAAIRPFATQQMALLVENSAVIMAKGRRNSSAEVKLAAVFGTLFFIVVLLGAVRSWMAGGRIL